MEAFGQEAVLLDLICDQEAGRAGIKQRAKQKQEERLVSCLLSVCSACNPALPMSPTGTQLEQQTLAYSGTVQGSKEGRRNWFSVHQKSKVRVLLLGFLHTSGGADTSK